MVTNNFNATAPIILIGMPGAGKTTVGKLLAQELGVPFLDSDTQIERTAGVSIPEIFAQEGEAGFRLRESRALAQLVTQGPAVLATGGGAVLSPLNRSLLNRSGFVVYLRVTAEEAYRRTEHDTGRPLLAGDDRLARLQSLLEARAPLYGATAHVSFHSSSSNPRRLIERILSHPRVSRFLKETWP